MQKVRSLRPFFATHMLQNKELLLLKQRHLKIAYTDRNVSFKTIYPVTIVMENCAVKNLMNAKKTSTALNITGKCERALNFQTIIKLPDLINLGMLLSCVLQK